MNKMKLMAMMNKKEYARSIFPSLGVELLSDPGLEGTYTLGLCAGLTKTGSPTVAQSANVHGGTKAQQFVATLQNDRLSTLYDTTLIINKWFLLSVWSKRILGTGGTASVRFLQTALNSPDYSIPVVSAVYGRYFGSIVTLPTNLGLRLYPAFDPGVSNFDTIISDDLSVKEITFSTCLATPKHTSTGDCIISQRMRLFQGKYLRMGFCINLDSLSNPQNYVLACIDGVNAFILTCLNGAYSSYSTACVWANDDELKVIKSGTSYSIYKNGTQLGVTQTINQVAINNNTLHMQFSTHGNNIFTSQFSVANP
jgi:hypothetical protein